MKSKKCKQITSLCLLLSILFSFCSCGNVMETEDENAALAKEHVYQFQEITMPDLGGDEISVCASAYRDQTVSLLIKVTDWEDYNDNDIRILRFRTDNLDCVVSTLETIPWNPAAGDDDSSENSYYDHFVFGTNGNIYALRIYHYEDFQGSEESVSETAYFLCCWEGEGKLLWESRLDHFPDDDGYATVNTLSVGADNVARLILTGSCAWQISVDAQGTSSDLRRLSDKTFQAFENSLSVVHQTNGSLLLVCYGEDNWEEQYLIPYDPATDILGEACRMPSFCGWDGYSAIAADSASGLLYGNRAGICSCAPGDTVGTEKMNFINSDLNVSSFDALVNLDHTSFAGLFYEGYGNGASMGIFTYRDPADLPDRSVLTLAGIYLNDNVMQRVVEFNRSNSQYRIVIQNLEEYDSDEELASGMAELTGGAFSGQMPDILVTEGLPAEVYAANGLLADIGKWIQKDKELSETAFLQNVFDAYSTDDKLYYLIPSFSIHTMIGASSVVGDKSSWTFSEALQLLKTLPEGTNLIPEADRASFLQTMMTYSSGCFIDPGAGKCSFQSKNFPAILEYAKSLPDQIDENSFDEGYWRNYEAQCREGRTVLAGMAVSSFDDVSYYVNDIFGKDISYIGFPTEDGSGSYIRAEESYALSARSRYPEGAWEFLRYYLTDEYQSDLKTGLPVQTKYFLKRSEGALEKSRSYNTDADSDLSKPLTEEQLEELVRFLLSVNRRYYFNEDLMNIVKEEAEAFFAGHQTAREAAAVIQNRVQLYLDENQK